MKKNHKHLLGVFAVVVLIGGVALLNYQSSQFRGGFDLRDLVNDFPTFECDRAVASIVASDVTSEITSTVTSLVTSQVPSEVTSDGGTSIVVSEVTSEVSSQVPSLVTSKVPQCVPKKKDSRSFFNFWAD